MTSKQFEDECHTRILGWLWDESINADYQESVTLTIAEMRTIANHLRRADGRREQAPRPWSEREEEKSRR